MNRCTLKCWISTLFIALVAAMAPIVASAADDADSWVDRLKWSGDFRLRYEGIDEEGIADRNRARFRTRFGFETKINDDTKVVIRFATGGDNPTSTNQSFDDGFSTKDIGLDRAYVDWAATEELHILAGKMKNPLFIVGGHGLVWDSDLSPEGFALQYKSGIFFGNVVGWIVEERSSADESTLLGAQGGLNFDLDNGKLTAGASYFDYSETTGMQPFYDGSAHGNSVDINGNLLSDYKELELFAQFETTVGDLPVTVFTDWVRNSEVDAEDAAYAFGISVGAAKAPGTSQFAWVYQDIEADAVLAVFSDSDFGGGGTDVKGHLFKGKYALRKNVFLGLTYMLADADEYAGNKHDYSRYQLDIEFKF